MTMKPLTRTESSFWAAFKENGIGAVTNVAASISSCKTTLELARNHDFMYAALGVHPSESAELSDEGLKDIEAWYTERTGREGPGHW